MQFEEVSDSEKATIAHLLSVEYQVQQADAAKLSTEAITVLGIAATLASGGMSAAFTQWD